MTGTPVRPATRAAALLAALALAAALTACDDETSSADGTGSAPTAASEEPLDDALEDADGRTPTACVTGTWHADVDGLAQQIADMLAATGMPVITHRAVGDQTLHITEDGGFRFETDVAITVDYQVEGAPLTTVAQRHTGAVTGSWAWESSTGGAAAMAFEGLDSSTYTIESTVSMNGTPIDIPLDALPMDSDPHGLLYITCERGTMTTLWEDAPFVTTWRR